jgi:hypothetical protein
MKTSRTRVAVAGVTTLAAASLSIILVAGPASATTVAVADEVGYRSALTALSSDPTGPHVIEVSADIVLASSDDPLYTGTQPLTINGNGFALDGSGNSSILRVDPPTPVSVALALNNLTVTNGSAPTSGAAVSAPGPVTVVDSTFTNNDSGALASTLSVAVTGSTFEGNDTTTGGGAITTVEAVTVTDSTFTGNSPGAIVAYAFGGGSVLPPVQITGSTFTANTDSAALRVGGNVELTDSSFTDNAGAVFTGPSFLVTPGGSVTATGSTFTGNDAVNNAGAIQAGGAVTVVDSTLSDNSNSSPLGSGGGAVNAGGPVIISRSTLSRNVSPSAEGGAVAAFSSQVRVVDSTFFANASGAGGGGAIRADSVVATNSTFTLNKAVTTSAGGIGGAIGADNAIDLIYSTVVQNEATNGGANLASNFGPVTSYGSVVALPEFGVTNCVIVNPGTFTSNGYNYSDDSSCGFTGTGDTQGGADPRLEALGDFGGPTQTRPPTVTSPLVDAIPVGDCDPGVTTDQRGESRPADGDGDGTSGCDIGAVELATVQVPPSAPGPPPWAPGPPPWAPGPPPWARGPKG